MRKTKILLVCTFVFAIVFLRTAPPARTQTAPGEVVMTPDVKVISYISEFSVANCYDKFGNIPGASAVQRAYMCEGLDRSDNPDPPSHFDLDSWSEFKRTREYRGYSHIFPGYIVCSDNKVVNYLIPDHEHSYGYTKVSYGVGAPLVGDLSVMTEYHRSDPFVQTPEESDRGYNDFRVQITNDGQSLLITDNRAARVSNNERLTLYNNLGYDAPFIYTNVAIEVSCVEKVAHITVDRSNFPTTLLYINDEQKEEEEQEEDKIDEFVMEGGDLFYPPGVGYFAPAGNSLIWSVPGLATTVAPNINLPGPWTSVQGYWEITPNGIHVSRINQLGGNTYLVSPANVYSFCLTADIALQAQEGKAGLAFGSWNSQGAESPTYVAFINESNSQATLSFQRAGELYDRDRVSVQVPTSANSVYTLRVVVDESGDINVYVNGVLEITQAMLPNSVQPILWNNVGLAYKQLPFIQQAAATFQNITLYPQNCEPDTPAPPSLRFVNIDKYGVGFDCANPGQVPYPRPTSWHFRAEGILTGYTPILLTDNDDGFWVPAPCDAENHWPLVVLRDPVPINGTYGWDFYVRAWQPANEFPPNRIYTMHFFQPGKPVFTVDIDPIPISIPSDWPTAPISKATISPEDTATIESLPVVLDFQAQTFAGTVDIGIDVLEAKDLPGLPPVTLHQKGILPYELTITYASSSVPAQLKDGRSYNVQLIYADDEISEYAEETLALYYWDDTQEQWRMEPTSQINTEQNEITAIPNHLATIWAVMGQKSPPDCTYSVSDGSVYEVGGLVDTIHAANNAGGPVTVCLAENGTYTLTTLDNNLNGLPIISGNITIEGNQATITRLSADPFRIFEVSSNGRLLLNDIVLSQGNLSEAFGGAILNSQGEVYLYNTTLTSNYARIGGALYNDDGQLTVARSEVSGNSSYHGGALANKGNNGEMAVVYSLLQDNLAAANGGAVYNEDGRMQVFKSELIANQAGQGGAVYQGGASGLLTIQNSQLTQNQAASGGAINLGGGLAMVNESELIANQANGRGGAIYHVPSVCCDSTLYIQHSLIQENITFQYGGTIYSFAPINIANSTIANNLTGTGGAALWSASGATITNSTISGNETDGDFGILYTLQGGLLIQSSSILDNNTPAVSPGTIVIDYSSVTFANTIIANTHNCSYRTPNAVTVSNGNNLENQDTCGFDQPNDLVQVDPLLGPLLNNGGETATHALLKDSPAIDSGNDDNCWAIDQRGLSRPIDGTGDGNAYCDIGAYEAELLIVPDYGSSLEPDTNLLLYFNDPPYFMGADGEIPLSSGLISISIEEGLFGQAAFFPATTNELYYNSQDNIDEQVGTLDFWIQPAWHGNDNQDHTVLRYGYWGGLIFSKDAGNYLRGVLNRFADGGNPEVNVEADISHWVANEWHHVAYTWDANSVQLYIDGLLQDEAAVTVPLPLIGDTSFQIGGDNTSSYLGAKLDDFRISSRVRTAAEILATYQYGSQFINQENRPPLPAANPTPADGATDQPVDVTLGWDTAVDPDGDPVTYDVYFGTHRLFLEQVSAGQTTTSFVLDNLLYDTLYYWQVDAKDDQGNVTEGPVWEFVTAPLPDNILAAGHYEETDVRLTYTNTPSWLPWIDTRYSRNTILYTSDPAASVSFQIYGHGLTIYRSMDSTLGSMEVCIDGGCTIVSNVHASGLFQSPVSFTGLEFGVHQVEIKNRSNSTLVFDAVRIIDTQPLGNGIHQNNSPNIVYSGKWIEWVHSNPSQGSLTYVQQAGATAEFQIEGDTMILYRTVASGWGSLEVCIDERPCENVSSAAATSSYNTPRRFDDLGSGIHNVVIRVASAATVDIDAIEVLTENGALQTGLHQQTSELIEQVGVWQTYASAQTNGGTAVYSNDPAAEIRFSVEGDHFVVLRSTGPNRANTEVCVDDVCEIRGNFDTEYHYNQPLVIDGLGSGVHEVVIKNASSSTGQYVTFDAVLLPEPLPVGVHQETNTNLLFQGEWVQWYSSDFARSDKYTYDNAASVEFSFIGDGLILRRPTSAGRTDINVCVDDTICAYGKGYSADTIWDVPVSITNLGMGLHHVRIYPIISTPFDAVLIDVDEIEILGPSVPVLPGQTHNPDDDSHFVHNGRWQKAAVPNSVGGNIFYNNQIGDTIDFLIEGDEMIVYFTQASWGGILEVCIDGACEIIDQYSATTVPQASRLFSNLGDGLHEVTISNASYSIFTSNIWVDVEAVEVVDTP